MIPWKYHQLTPRDMSGELLRKWNRFASGSTGVASEGGQNFPVAEDNFLVLTTIGCESTAAVGGAQAIGLRLTVLHNNIAEFQALYRHVSFADVGGRQHGGIIVPVWLMAPGGAVVSLTVVFTTNDDHSYIVSAAGVLIPRGEMGDF